MADGVNPVEEDPQSYGVYDCDPAHCCKLANAQRQYLLDLYAEEKAHLFKSSTELRALTPELRAGVVVLRDALADIAIVEACADLVQYDARLPRRAAVMASNTIKRQITERNILPEDLAKVTREMVGAPPAVTPPAATPPAAAPVAVVPTAPKKGATSP